MMNLDLGLIALVLCVLCISTTYMTLDSCPPNCSGAGSLSSSCLSIATTIVLVAGVLKNIFKN